MHWRALRADWPWHRRRNKNAHSSGGVGSASRLHAGRHFKGAAGKIDGAISENFPGPRNTPGLRRLSGTVYFAFTIAEAGSQGRLLSRIDDWQLRAGVGDAISAAHC